MPTYKQIQKYVKNVFGYLPKTCWISDVKRQMGYNVRNAHNRENENYIKHKCPNNKVNNIKEAINKLGG